MTKNKNNPIFTNNSTNTTKTFIITPQQDFYTTSQYFN